MKNKRSFLFSFVIIWLTLLSACAFRIDESSNDSAQMERQFEEDGSFEDVAPEEAFDSTANQVGLDLGDKIIENASLSYETTSFKETTDFINEQIEVFEAILESSSKGQSNSSYGFMGEYISMTIRLPNDSLHPFIAELNNYKNLYLQNEDISRVDVTKEFRDNETRLAVLKEEEEALRNMLQEQATLEEVLQIRTRLSEVISEREIYENENKYYDDQSAFSTIYLYVQEADRANPRNLGNFWDRISAAFIDSFYRFIAVSQNLLISLVYFIPYLMIILLLALLFYYVRKYFHKDKL